MPLSSPTSKLIALAALAGLIAVFWAGMAVLAAVVRPNKPTPTATAPPNYGAAGNILLADDDHYRQVMSAGPVVQETRAYIAWWKRASTDVQWHDDLAKAEAYFTLDTEPAALVDAWRNDNGNAVMDVYQLAAAHLAAQPGPPTAEMHEWEIAFQANITKADTDARNLQAVH